MDQSTNSTIQSAEQAAVSWDYFHNLPDERAAFYGIATRRVLRRKERLFMEGDLLNSVYYVLEGELILTRLTSSGKEVVAHIVTKGALLGAWSTMVNWPQKASAQSLTASVVYEARANDFRNLIAEFPLLAERTMLQHRISSDILQAQYMSVFCDSPEIRLIKFIARLYSEQLLSLKYDNVQHTIQLNATQDQLASSVGITRPRVNKILHRLMAEGLINISAHKITFLKPAFFLSHIE
jgi:CRP-like cAMP-binding protein